MIVFKNNETNVDDIKQNNLVLDGTYYALIIRGYPQLNEENFVCSIYIPEVYGPPKYQESVNLCIVDYPRVIIPFRQDADDPGHEPLVGEVCCVSFDDGNPNACRFLFYVPVADEQIIAQNAMFINNNILASEIEDISNPKILKKLQSLLPEAYYITLGKKTPSESDFAIKNLVSDCGRARYNNFFVNPLTLPIASYNQDWGSGQSTKYIPLMATGIYNLSDVMINIYNKSDATKKQLLDIFNNPAKYKDTGFKDYLPFYDLNEEPYKSMDEGIREKFITSVISGFSPYLIDILFPKNTEIPYFNDSMDSFLPYCVPAAYWSWYQTISVNKNLIANLLYKNKDFYEKEWLQTAAGWMTGLNNIVKNGTNAKSRKMKYALIMCFTVCPWLAPVVIGYLTRNTKQVQAIMNSKQYSDYYYEVSAQEIFYKNATDYVTTFNTVDDYKEAVEKLHKSIKADNIIAFYEVFREICENIYKDGREDNARYPVNTTPLYPDPNTPTWNLLDFKAKFDRLKTVLDKIVQEPDEEVETNNIYSAIVGDYDFSGSIPDAGRPLSTGQTFTGKPGKVNTSIFVADSRSYFSSELYNSSTSGQRMAKYTSSDLDLLSRLVYAEAGVEDFPDWVMMGVASVVLNRMFSKYYPNTLHDVIYQSGQYACTWDGGINKTPSAKAKKNAKYVLDYGSIFPADIYGQASEGIFKMYGKRLVAKFSYGHGYDDVCFFSTT